jgi:hypothetical protein
MFVEKKRVHAVPCLAYAVKPSLERYILLLFQYRSASWAIQCRLKARSIDPFKL